MTALVLRWPRHIREPHDVASCRHCSQGFSCPVADGGLFTCAACGASEGQLPSECPGHRVHVDVLAAVYFGSLDYTVKLGWFNPVTGERLGRFKALEDKEK